MPPIAAVREGSTLPPSRFAAHSLKAGGRRDRRARSRRSASACSRAGSSALAVACCSASACSALFLGVALLAPRLVKPLARVVGWPARRAGGVAGELASANSMRNPGRTASTAAALMIGLTLVTVVAVLGAGISAATESAVTEQVHADYVVDGTDGVPFRAAEGDALARVPGREGGLARPLRQGARAGQGDARHRRRPGDDRALLQVQLDRRAPTRTLGAARRPTARSSPRRYADDQHLAVGERLPIETPAGDKRTRRRARHLRPARGEPMLGDVTHEPAGVRHRRSRSRRTASRSSTPAPAPTQALKAAVDGLRRRQAPHRRRLRRRTRRRTWRASWTCSTCCSASRSS